MKSSVPTELELQSARLWLASLTLLAGLEKDFFSHWKKAARTFDENEVHDLRVASRRLREGLTLFSPCFPRKKIAKLSKQVRNVTGMLGNLRNTDEASLFFSDLSAEETSLCRHEVDQLLRVLSDERQQAHQKLENDLKKPGPGQLRNEFSAIRSRPNLFKNRRVDPFISFMVFAGEALMERADKLDELLPRAVHGTDIAAQHQLRIAVKKMRYRLEIIAPIFKNGCDELRAALKNYQDVLGKLHDVDVFGEMVRERISDGPGREELLLVMADRRKVLFACFLETVDRFPLRYLTDQTMDALRTRQALPDRSPVPRSLCRPAPQKEG